MNPLLLAALLSMDAETPRPPCRSLERTLALVTPLMENEWWRLSPNDLRAKWPVELKETGCGTKGDTCLTMTWCGALVTKPHECACVDQFAFSGDPGKLRLDSINVTVAFPSRYQAFDAAHDVQRTLEALPGMVRSDCDWLAEGMKTCYELKSSDAKHVSTVEILALEYLYDTISEVSVSTYLKP